MTTGAMTITDLIDDIGMSHDEAVAFAFFEQQTFDAFDVVFGYARACAAGHAIAWRAFRYARDDFDDAMLGVTTSSGMARTLVDDKVKEANALYAAYAAGLFDPEDRYYCDCLSDAATGCVDATLVELEKGLER